MGSTKSQSPFHPVLRMIPAASTSLIGASVCSVRYPRLDSGSPLESREIVTRFSAMCTFNSRSAPERRIEGRRPYLSLKWSAMPSFTRYVTNLEWLNSALFTVESIAKVESTLMNCSQSRSRTLSYSSSVESAVNFTIGLRILRAVRQHRLARYISSLSPSNVTILSPNSTFSAPRSMSSSRSTSSRPWNVLATIWNLVSIFNKIVLFSDAVGAPVYVSGFKLLIFV